MTGEYKNGFEDDEDDEDTMYSSSLQAARNVMSREQRRTMRNSRKSKDVKRDSNGTQGGQDEDDRFALIISRNEDELLQFVAKVNKVYQENLKRPAPFMTFVLCGMQSAGKSTIMERFLGSALNIVQQGTGTRCPLDSTCIHDSTCLEPRCELFGEELPDHDNGKDLAVHDVFQRITNHNRKLGQEDRFSTLPLYLVYRSATVQNMRFVDTPGIISNMSTGKDNREDIKTILRSEMRKPNTKLCVLLEPKEFATNPIMNFCDESLGGRDKWIKNATFLMTKFDKQLDDARTATKANDFFEEFHQNQCFPYLIITPTLDREDLPPEELFTNRMKLIAASDEFEKDKFEMWIEGHERFNSENGGSEPPLKNDISKRLCFHTAKKNMREIMLKDTVERLPEVLSSLRTDLNRCNAEHKLLSDRKKFNDAQNLRNIVSRMLYYVQERIVSYLDGDLALSLKFPDKLQTLFDEIEDEEESDWCSKELNFHSEKEDHWRDRVTKLQEYPNEINPDDKFLGGKQYQRALEFFRVVMIDALPDPYQLRDKVANVTGFLSGGLQHENWERAMVEITRVCLKDVSHPGLNYLIKHVGAIFRRLFMIALDDVRQGEEYSAEFKQIPPGLERFLVNEFDDMLWSLMIEVSDAVHSSMEPMYSSIDPNLPTFQCTKIDVDSSEIKSTHFIKRGDDYVLASHAEEEREQLGWIQSLQDKLSALTTSSNKSAKNFLREENRKRATTRKSFLPDERAAMITKKEIDMILKRSFEYIVGLLEFNLFVFKFQLNHHFYQGFKKSIRSTLIARVNEADWDELVRPDPGIDKRLLDIDNQIKGLSDSLRDVQRMHRNI
jgi:Dynamin family